VHPAAQVDQAVGPLDECGEDVRGEDVRRQQVRVPVGGLDPLRLAVADARVVDDGVHPAEGVDLIGHADGLRRAREVADRDAGRLRADVAEVGRSGLAARVEHDLVPVVEQHARRREPEPVGRSGDEDACHIPTVVPIRVRRGSGEAKTR
jgi:hypothetical protein